MNEAITAARLSLQPYVTSDTDFAVDIISVQYDADNEPQELWRETRNMLEQEDLLEKTEGLGMAGEGSVAVSVLYRYQPTFGSVVINQINMRETAFARGRRSAIVERE